MKLNKYSSNEQCIGQVCFASIKLRKPWVCYSDEEWVYDEWDGDKLVREYGFYRDVYMECGRLAYSDGECCKVIGYDEAAETVTLFNDNAPEKGNGRSLAMSGDSTFVFTIPYKQFKADFAAFYKTEFTHTNTDGEICINELVCRRCKSSVYKSNNPEYVYQCYICDEDLYSIEVEQREPPAVEGTKEFAGFKGPGYVIELCSHCMNETFNIPDNRVSLCAHCGEELFPCAGCEDDDGNNNCSWSSYDKRCLRFNHSAATVLKMLTQHRDVAATTLQSLEARPKPKDLQLRMETDIRMSRLKETVTFFDLHIARQVMS